MSGYQFLHLETYGFVKSNCPSRTSNKKQRRAPERKWTIQEVIDEAMRVEGACDHVKDPEIPEEAVSVIPLKDLMSELKQRREASTDPLGRKIRKDALCLLAGISSYPVPYAELKMEEQFEELGRFFRETITFLEKKFGNALVNVTIHLDEEFPHCHFYCIPEAGKGTFNMLYLHPGITARENAASAKKGGSKEDRQRRDEAYLQAMRQFQDDYYYDVGMFFGMGRIGPKRERLSRDEWLTRQRENDRYAVEARRLKQSVEEAEQRSRAAEERLKALEATLKLED